MSKLQFQAHRGDSAYCPENTLPAFEAAVEQGYDVIEMDTKFTEDNVCVMLHDHTLNRTARYSDGRALETAVAISSITYEEAKQYDYGLFMGEQFKGTQIPTLAETLAFLKGKPIKIKLDNVFQSFNEERFEIFCRVVEEADMADQVGFTCSTLPYLCYLAERFPRAELHYDGSLTDEALKICKSLGETRAVTLWIPYDNNLTSWFKERKADAAFCRELHKYGKVGLWIITEKQELAEAKNIFFADIIETDGKLKPYMLEEV